MGEDDRRRFAREQCLISGHVRAGSQIYDGTLVNIGEEGAYVATRAPVAAGDAVQLRFRHPWSDETVTARAVVMRRVHPGETSGPRVGVALALLDSLSDLEEEPALVSSSGSFPPDAFPELKALRERARNAARAQSIRRLSSPGSAVPRPRAAASPGLNAVFTGTGRPPTRGGLRNLSATGFAISTDDPPSKDRLVRIEINDPDPTLQPLRIAGKVTWSSASGAVDGGDGFGIRILHFLSSHDEERYRDLVHALKGS